MFYGEAGRIPEPRCPLGGGGRDLYLFGRKRGGTESSLRSMGRSGPSGLLSVFTIRLEQHLCELLGRHLASSRKAALKEKIKVSGLL